MSRSVVTKQKTTSMQGEKSCPRGLNCPYISEHQHSSEYSHVADSRNGPASRSKPGKKKCDLGLTCPYQDEFQHLQEYDHYHTEMATLPANSKGRTLVGRSCGGAPKRTIQADIDIVRKKRCSAFGLVAEDVSSTGVDCDICGQTVTLGCWDTHARQHEAGVFTAMGSSSFATLKRIQDEEYELCQMQDILRMSEQVELERQLKEGKNPIPSLVSVSSSAESSAPSYQIGSAFTPKSQVVEGPATSNRSSAPVVDLLDNDDDLSLRGSHSSNCGGGGVVDRKELGLHKASVFSSKGAGELAGQKVKEVVVVDLDSPVKQPIGSCVPSQTATYHNYCVVVLTFITCWR